jgi:hypothetical protein
VSGTGVTNRRLLRWGVGIARCRCGSEMVDRKKNESNAWSVLYIKRGVCVYVCVQVVVCVSRTRKHGRIRVNTPAETGE